MKQNLSVDLVEIPIGTGETVLSGEMTFPEEVTALVAFAHGSGSSRLSPRNQHVAGVLNEAHLATLLFDLLTPQEEAIDEQTRHLRFDIELLCSRLVGVVDWLLRHERTRHLRIGLFGASTGAAGALATAAARPSVIRAVVSRGGRPDLASHALPAVKAPTLLIVGELDSPVIDLNRQAAKLLRAEHRFEVIPCASHLFTESGALEKVAGLARDWFVEHLVNVWRE